MDHTFNISEFNHEKLFSVLRDQYKIENELITEDIYCRNIKDLRKTGGVIICCMDIFRFGLPVEDYFKFSMYNEDWDSVAEEYDEEEKARIMKLSKECGWTPDDGLNAAINGEEIGLAIKVSLVQDMIRMQKGLVRSDPESGSEFFQGVEVFGMPEINKFIDDFILSCKLPS